MAKSKYVPNIDNEMQSLGQALISKEYKAISKNELIKGNALTVDVYQGDKYVGGANIDNRQTKLGNFCPRIKASLFGFGKCKNVKIFYLNRQKWSAPVSLHARSFNGKSISFRGYCECRIKVVYLTKFLAWAKEFGLKPNNGTWLSLYAIQDKIINKTLPRYFETTLFNATVESNYFAFSLDKVEHKELFDKIVNSVANSMSSMGVELEIDLIKK
ncbi:MAG: hypothetical protein J6U92_01405 [Clostridia bacterium]|nr:hypothetical protein [Clostridia bacterium]